MREGETKSGNLRAHGGLLLLLIGYLSIAGITGSRVGLQFDEVNFAVAALGVEDPGNFFVRHRTKVGPWTLPAAISSYRGALKAWVYAPVLREISRSELAVRLVPASAFVVLLLALWLALRRWCGGAMATGIVATLATHPEVVWCTIFDWGPVVFGLIGATLGTVALVGVHRRARTGRMVSAALLAVIPGLAFGLAVFDKASNLWLVGCCGLALLAAGPRHWFALRGLVLVPGLVVGAAAGCWPMIDYNLVQHAATGLYPTLQAAAGPGPGDLLATLQQSLGGQGAFGFISGLAIELRHPLVWILAALPLLWWRLRGTGDGARLRFFGVLAGLLLLGMIRSPQPIGPHHAVVLVAALLLLVGATAGALWRTEGVADRLLAASLLAFTIFCSFGLTMGQTASLTLSSGRGGWDRAHTAWLKALPAPAERFVIMDWGITSPLALVHGRDTRFLETYFAFDSKDAQKKERLATWMKNLAAERGNLLLLHGARHTRTPGARELMAELLRKGELSLELVSEVRSSAGEVLGLAVRGADDSTPDERRLGATLP